jgi:hypothetical protein
MYKILKYFTMNHESHGFAHFYIYQYKLMFHHIQPQSLRRISS